MPQLKHSTHSVTLEVPYEEAFAYISDWRNQPNWATQFVKGVREENGQIIMTTPFGDNPIEWRVSREHGVIDIVNGDGSVTPTRLIAIGDSLVYTFTFSMPVNTPQAVFEEGQRGMDHELSNLKRLLETQKVK